MIKDLIHLRKKIIVFYLQVENIRDSMMQRFIKQESYYIYKFMLYLRFYEYFIKQKTNLIISFIRIVCMKKYQQYANKLGFVIGDGVLGENVKFFHRGSIIINPNARVGDGCKFHGDACLGVKKTGEEGAPVLGKDVDIGVGARILGDVYIADNIVIGANAVVTQSFYEPGIVIAGMPARKVNKTM